MSSTAAGIQNSTYWPFFFPLSSTFLCLSTRFFSFIVIFFSCLVLVSPTFFSFSLSLTFGVFSLLHKKEQSRETLSAHERVRVHSISRSTTGISICCVFAAATAAIVNGARDDRLFHHSGRGGGGSDAVAGAAESPHLRPGAFAKRAGGAAHSPRDGRRADARCGRSGDAGGAGHRVSPCRAEVYAGRQKCRARGGRRDPPSASRAGYRPKTAKAPSRVGERAGLLQSHSRLLRCHGGLLLEIWFQKV